MKGVFLKRGYFLAVVGIVLAAGYGCYRAWDRMFWLEWQGLGKREVLAERLLDHKKAVFQRYRSSEAQRLNMLEVYRQHDPDEHERSRMLLFLQDLSSRSSTRIVDMKPGPIKSGRLSREFPVNMTLEGSFVDILRFFYGIETEGHGFQIQEFRFSPPHTSKGLIRCQAVVARIFLSQG